MGRFLAGLFGKQGQPTAPAAATQRVQSSLYGKAIPWLIAGQQRLGSNLIWYGKVFAVDQSSAGSQGGKGGYFTQGTPNNSKFYYASIAFCIAEGPVAGILSIWPHGTPRDINGWARQFDTSETTVSPTVFLGDHAQMPWGFLEANKPDQALAYRGLAYVGVVNFPLGPSASLPNVNWEVQAINSYPFGPSGQPDGDPSIALSDFLTDQYRSVHFPTARIGDLTLYKNYCLANALLISPVLEQQINASAHLIDQMAATNSEARWSSGQLTIIPYGDQPVVAGQVQQTVEPHTIPLTGKRQITVNNAATFTANVSVVLTSDSSLFTQVAAGVAPKRKQYSVSNGLYQFNANDKGLGVTITYTWAATASYQPQVQPLYDLTTDDFLPNQGSLGSGNLPGGKSYLVISRQQTDKIPTSMRVECLDRNFAYNPQPIEIKNEALILLQNGRERPASVKQLHMIALTSVAQFAATQMLIRASIPRMFQFTVSRVFIVPDVLDNLTVTDPAQNIFRQLVKIREIQENSDKTLTFTCEEAPGTASAPLFGTEAAQGYIAANNADPGSVDTPIIFEPTAEFLAGASPEVWAGCTGGPDWGGCFVWVSTDGGQNYVQLPGQLSGPTRMGKTLTDLVPVPVNNVGQTHDDVNVLGVDISQSANGVLITASDADAQALRTACLIADEIIAYQNAALISTGIYDLSGLVRGAFGTEDAIPTTHPAGSQFMRLDAGVFRFPIKGEDVGKQLFIKFQSFNLFNEHLQSLADCPVFTYTVTGRAYTSPLPVVLNIATAVVDGRLAISWDEIGSRDFRGGIFYEIRAGSSFDGAQTIAIVAHPPYVVPNGTNTYWVTGYCQPLPAQIVRSETPVSIAIVNPQVPTNIIASFDYQAAGWPGTFGNGAAIDTSINAVRTGGSDNILLDNLIEITPLSGYAITSQQRPDHPVATGGYSRQSGGTGVSSSGFAFPRRDPGTDLTILARFMTSVYVNPNILDAGGEVSGTYTPTTVVDIGRVDTCPVYIDTIGTGVPIGQNILAINDILGTPDILGSASAQYISVYPEIAVAQGDGIFGAYQKFVPGKFTGRYFKPRWQLITNDPNTIAYLLSAKFSVDVPDRVDTLISNATLNSTAGPVSFNFRPDGAAVDAAFNGGPQGTLGALPLVVVTWAGADKATGDFEVISSLTLSGVSVQIKNAAGAGVSRTGVTIRAFGW